MYRITECLSLEGTSRGHLVQSSVQAGPYVAAVDHSDILCLEAEVEIALKIPLWRQLHGYNTYRLRAHGTKC